VLVCWSVVRTLTVQWQPRRRQPQVGSWGNFLVGDRKCRCSLCVGGV